VSDDSNDQEGFVFIKKFKIQNPSSLLFPSRKRRKDFYIFDSNDKKINEKINIKEIDGEKTDDEKTDEIVNIKKDIKEIIENINKKIVRIRNDKEIKRARISLPYYGKMEYRRKENLEYKVKSKIARRRRD
jgi:hypothetical protein